MGKKLKYHFFLCCLLFSIVGCENGCNKKIEVDNVDTTETKSTKKVVNFNQDSAFDFVKKQVDFGPRVPGSNGHFNCHQFLLQTLTHFADTVYTQNSTAKTFDNKIIPVKNIIASFNPKAIKRVIICAHWDTRPFADQDDENKDKPILGANDGASGVGVILQIASVLKTNKIDYGIDLILFDAEDWGDNSGQVPDSYCLGSQFWAKNPHVTNYKADFGILLDMVGAKDALFGYEGTSMDNASYQLNLVWSEANESGYGKYFVNAQRGYITDDHYYMMKYLPQIPVIDIIHFDPTTNSRFGKYWHTHDDNMDAVDKNTLKAVGQTMLNVIYNY
mgnify:CR=1 FL=1